MLYVVEATYDGSKLVLDKPLPLPPGTRAWIRIERVLGEPSTDQPASSIDTAPPPRAENQP